MTGAKWRSRCVFRGSVAALLISAATAAYAQEPGDPPPPQPDTTTVQEPIAEEDTPPPEPTPEPQGPERVPPNAGGIDLSTLETDNFSLLYFDPVQTYLTPYLGRSVENALAWHKKMFEWEPWDRTTVLLRISATMAMPPRSDPQATWCCSTLRRCRCRWRLSRPASASSR